MDAKQVNEALARDAERVARLLLPNGKREGNEWRAGDLNGSEGKSLGVRLTGDKAGVWCDFSSGESGGMLDLWMQTRNVDFKTAFEAARELLGASKPVFHAQTRKSYTKPAKPPCKPANGDSLDYLVNERMLSPETVDAYRVSVMDSGEIVFPVLVDSKLVNCKYLRPRKADGEKNGWRQEPNPQPSLFGWQSIHGSARSVVITEGEIDAMSVHEVGYAALSMPSGSKNLDWIEQDFDLLDRFESIILCLDQDAPGQEALAKIIPRFDAARVLVAKLPRKDANEMLKHGEFQELKEAIRCASSIDPEELKNASAYMEEVRQFRLGGVDSSGVRLPWDDQGKDLILLRRDELSIWTGINGHGKSRVLGHVVVEAMYQGEKVCIFSAEMKPVRLLDGMAKQAGGVPNMSDSYFSQTFDFFGSHLWLFDLTGTAKADRLLEVFQYARQRYGVTFFVIDSLMKCGLSEDDYDAQKIFIDRLCDFKKKFDCHIALVAHPRKGEDEGRVPNKLDVKGAGSITDLADSVFIVWRNKKKADDLARLISEGEDIPDDLKSKPDALVKCVKQRNGDYEGGASLMFDKDTYQYVRENKSAFKYVDSWSKRNR